MLKKKKEKEIVVGRTIVGDRELTGKKKEEKAQIDSLDTERERVRKRSKRRVAWSVVLMVILVGSVVALGGMFIKNLIEIANEQPGEIVSEEKAEPTAEIIDENGGSGISERTKEFVGQLEADLLNLGYKMTRASLPVGKMREIDIHLENVGAYFKVNVDRGTAVTAEDIVRMVKYLETNGISATYVDVRVEEKAFYK